MSLAALALTLRPGQGHNGSLPGHLSSVVEQLFRKQQVVGSSPTGGSRHLRQEVWVGCERLALDDGRSVGDGVRICAA